MVEGLVTTGVLVTAMESNCLRKHSTSLIEKLTAVRIWKPSQCTIGLLAILGYRYQVLFFESS
jgi:hypothetical protein